MSAIRATVTLLAAFSHVTLFALVVSSQQPTHWLAHDPKRPRPPVVDPGTQKLPVAAPEDAIVLFDGTSLSNFQSAEGTEAGWRLENGAMISVADAGYVYSKQSFGDAQVHVEWSAPLPAVGTGQARGNSGVFLMGKYEVQVLDCYKNTTYADGHAAAIYGQYPPLVNVCLPPGEWQSYDIVFRRPRFGREGELESPARMTVIHNGVLVQDNVELWGGTNWLQTVPYRQHPDRLPLAFQDHGNPVRFRNIWVRELPEWQPPGPPAAPSPAVALLTPDELQRYAGAYAFQPEEVLHLSVEGDRVQAHFNDRMAIRLVPRTRKKFDLPWTAAHIEFELDDNGRPTGLKFFVADEQRSATRR